MFECSYNRYNVDITVDIEYIIFTYFFLAEDDECATVDESRRLTTYQVLWILLWFVMRRYPLCMIMCHELRLLLKAREYIFL